MKKQLLATMCGLFVTTELHSIQTNTTNYKRDDFASGYLFPFEEDQGYEGDDVLDEGFNFVSASGNRYCLIEWKESEYDGTRRERGHEIKGQVTSDWVVYSGWQWYFPNSNNNFITGDKETIIWQMYCWNSAGCSNWTAHMTLDQDDLRFDYRAACVSSTRHTIATNLKKKQWYDVACALRPGDGNGLFQCKFGNNTVDLNLSNLNIGFGSKNSDGSMQDAVIGVKMGIYAADTANYTNNEQRRIRVDKLSVADRDSGTNASNSWNRVEPWEW